MPSSLIDSISWLACCCNTTVTEWASAWFGKSQAASQHLQLSQTRALEMGRTMLRSTNTGMTAIIRPDGNIDSFSAPFTRQVLQGFAEGRTGLTPYMRYGNLPVLLLCALMLLAPLVKWKKAVDSGRMRFRDHI